MSKKHGIIHGLTLTPEETSLFPQKHVFSYAGIGHYARPKKIILYQFGLNICPFLQGQRCTIYDRRPLACQAYPFEIEKAGSPGVLVDKNCRWFKENVVKGSLKKLLASKEEIIAREELEACSRQFQQAREFVESKNQWWFDLCKKAWFQRR